MRVGHPVEFGFVGGGRHCGVPAEEGGLVDMFGHGLILVSTLPRCAKMPEDRRAAKVDFRHFPPRQPAAS
jgi:hypothetical protein